jgi:hypothetical protein
MERPLTRLVTDFDAPVAASAEDPSPIPQPLWDYLGRVGIHSEALRASLARQCLQHSRKDAGQQAGEQLAAEAIEEVQRRLDRALAHALGLNPVRDAARLAGLRAALAMGQPQLSADFLFEGRETDNREEQLARLAARLPVAIPPEAHLPMPAQPFHFVFFKSS